MSTDAQHAAYLHSLYKAKKFGQMYGMPPDSAYWKKYADEHPNPNKDVTALRRDARKEEIRAQIRQAVTNELQLSPEMIREEMNAQLKKMREAIFTDASVAAVREILSNPVEFRKILVEAVRESLVISGTFTTEAMLEKTSKIIEDQLNEQVALFVKDHIRARFDVKPAPTPDRKIITL